MIDLMRKRVALRQKALEATGEKIVSDRGISKLVTGKVNLIREIRRGKEPGVFKSIKLALVLKCSLGYLTGDTDNPEPAAENSGEQALLLAYRQLPQKLKAAGLLVLTSLAEQGNNSSDGDDRGPPTPTLHH